jgi:hypothetical protein
MKFSQPTGRIKWRNIKFIISILILMLLSFKQPVETGKELFEKNCASCHKATVYFVAPPFQKIRDDYGVKWTIDFVKDAMKLIEKRDMKALFGHYKFQLSQPSFNNLTNREIIKILDYVDSFPFDSTQYQYRKVSEIERRKYIHTIESQYKEEQKTTPDSINHLRKTTKRASVKKSIN